MATFSPDSSGPGTMLKEARGTVLTPFLPNSYKRVVLLIDERDERDFDALGPDGTVEVEDLMTEQWFTIKRADCGLGCRCAAEIVQ